MRLVIRLFPWLFLVAGVVMLYFGVSSLNRARASVDWPSASGRIVSSSVERHHESRTRGRGSTTTYHAEVFYEFQVDGATYHGKRVAYGDYGSSSPSHARGIVNRYPEGKEVTVHYMPGNPEVCLLEPGVSLQAWILPGFGLIFLVVGSLMLVFWRKVVRQVDEFAERANLPDTQ
jgi:hypothetical protein